MSSSDSEPIDALVLDEDGELNARRVVGARHPGAAFARARFVDVELVRCDLSGCDFSEAVWQRVRLVDCRASAIELPMVNLRDVSFVDCRLDDANLRLAQLRNVRFADSTLARAEFVGARLDDVGFAGCDLAAADFSNSTCAAVDLQEARLDGIRGVGALGGATIGVEQLVGLAPALALTLGLRINTEEEPVEKPGAVAAPRLPESDRREDAPHS